MDYVLFAVGAAVVVFVVYKFATRDRSSVDVGGSGGGSGSDENLK